MFYKNIYANSLTSKALRYDMKLASLIHWSITIEIKLYKTFIKDSFNNNNLTIKFMTTNIYN